jgi:hypothetical protein
MRDKWDRKTGGTTYGAMTIDKAIADCTEFYTPGRAALPADMSVLPFDEPAAPERRKRKRNFDAPTLLNTVSETEISWLWEPYLQANNWGIIRGNGGVGKTYLVAAIASAISTEGARVNMPGTIIRTGNVIVYTAEDEAGNFKRRVRMCGGDFSKIAVSDRPFSMADGADALRNVIRNMKAVAVIFDPIQAYIGVDDMDKAVKVRPVLDGIRAVLRDENCSGVFIEHPGKSKLSDIVYRGLGSADIVNAVRCVYLCGFHPYNDDERVLFQLKTNAKRAEPAAFAILDDGAFEWRGIPDDELTAEQVATATGKFSKPSEIQQFVADGAAKLAGLHYPTGWSGGATEFLNDTAAALDVKKPFTAQAVGRVLNSDSCIVRLSKLDVTLTVAKAKGHSRYLVNKKLIY